MDKFSKHLGLRAVCFFVSLNLCAMDDPTSGTLQQAIEEISASQQTQVYEEVTVEMVKESLEKVTIDIDEELLDRKGRFKNSEILITFLKNAAKEGKISEDFNAIQEAHMLSEELRISRFWTKQLFLVTCENGKQYIIKEIRPKAKPINQVCRLQNAYKHSEIQEFVYPNQKNNLQFIFPSSYLRFLGKDKEHILAILPKAQGTLLAYLILEFAANPSREIIEQICKAYFDIGLAMANFYKDQGTLDKTVIHGSLHNANMLYDSGSRLVTLIDNDGIIASLKEPRDISKDLGILFAVAPFIINYTFKIFVTDPKSNAEITSYETTVLCNWYTIALTSFMFGFMSTYEQSERLGIFTRLKDFLFKFDTYFEREHIKQTEEAIRNVLISLESQYIEQHKTELEIIEGNVDLSTLGSLLSNN